MSTLRFLALPSSVLLSEIGFVDPDPLVSNFSDCGIFLDFKGIKKSEVPESKKDLISSTQKKASEDRPGILLMLSNDTGLATWSPSLWWSYQHPNKVQPGC
jgi:hypothetical protein